VFERVGVGEDEVGMSKALPRLELRAAGALPYREVVEVGMGRFLMMAAWVSVLGLSCVAQEPTAKPAADSGTAKGTTLIGCLAGPDADDHYTLTSMQHRLGVEVVGGDELKSGAGAKVKLTGSWCVLPGSEGKKGDAARLFKATAVSVMEEKCQAPTEATPVSKKKAAQQAEKKQ
jgi:hypothetical protein